MNPENFRATGGLVVDLAREGDFRLGGLKVCPSIREVERDGQHEALEPRVMQVLVALYQADGGVVSRDDLINRCWEGRIVGEDAISRAIWRLRKLAESNGSGNFSIETIPRVGYRLRVGPPISTPAAEADMSPEPPQNVQASIPVRPAKSRRPARWWLAASMALLAVVASGLAVWLSWPERRWTVESSRPFISSLAPESFPAFSPNGGMLAYTLATAPLSRQIYVRNVAGGDGMRITNDVFDDVSPSWSSDGVRIAYIAQKSGQPCRIMVATVPGGDAREVGRCTQAESSSVTWQPGTPFLYHTDIKGDRNFISRLDLDTGEKTAISGNGAAGGLVRDLRVAPDGRWLAYLRVDSFETDSVVIRDLSSGREKILGKVAQTATAAWVNTVAWSEDSRTVLASAANGIGSEVIAFPVSGETSYRLYAAATGISHLGAGRGGLLALVTNSGRKNLARAVPSPATEPDIIDPANGLTTSPTFAPDGTMAFISNRSGINAVWIMKPGAAPVRLYDAGFSGLFRENFSPDGTMLAIATTVPTGVTVKILTADGASVSSFDLPSVGSGMPTWTPDGKELIVFDSRIGRAIRVDVENPARRSPIAPPGWQSVSIRADGTFANRDDKPGLWRIDKGITLINAQYPGRFSPPIAFKGDEVLVPDFNAEGGARILAQPLTGGPARVIAYAPGAEDRNYKSKMTVNPKTGEIIYVASVLSDTNIDLLTMTKR